MLQTNVIINMAKPAITVLMPVYNAEAFLAEAIESILNQTFSDFEFIIINDGSTDSSEKIILSYNDPRIRYVKNEKNIRLIATLNKGIELAEGKYIVRMDADDVSMPERIAIQYKFMETHPDVGLCGTGFETFSEHLPSKVVQYSLDHETICLKHLYQIHLSHGTCIFRKEILDEYHLFFNPDFSHAEDYELWSRIAAVSKLANIQKILYRVRSHPDEVSVKHSETQMYNSQRVRKLNFKSLGVDVSDEELDLYKKIAQYEYELSMDFQYASKNLLEKIFLYAKDQNNLKAESIRKHIAALWFNVSINLTKLGLDSYHCYYNSPISKQLNKGWKYRFKFFIKAVFRL